MPLQQLPFEGNPISHRATPVQETAPVLEGSSVSEVATEQEADRYDAATVRKIIALAETMQARHRATLSVADIEELGRAFEVEPEFVRRALVSVAEETVNESLIISPRVRVAKPRVVTRHSIRLAAVLPLIYLFLSPVTYPWVFPNNGGYFWCYLYLPLALAFGKGFTRRYKRLGLVDGIFFGLAGLTAQFADAASHHWGMADRFDVVAVMFSIWIICGAIAGMVGAAVGNAWRKSFGATKQSATTK